MTGGFGRLLYTDCEAGKGRGAGNGLQVQALSPGVDSAQEQMAVNRLIYEPQNAWMNQRRPVGEFPLGFAHACGEGYGTAQGRYAGKEATGGRQGNHVTDCLLTRDPDLYGAVRPAQLWRSELWRGEPWASRDCPRFDGMLPLGPLSVDELAAWLAEDPAREPVLAALLSVLEEPDGRRVVITSDGPDAAMRWIAAATVLLPAQAALGVSFKVFCANHTLAPQRVAAVPRELNPRLAPGQGGSAFILDADRPACDEAEVSARARFWVSHLAGADDPYDVADAVELAESLSPGGGRAGLDAAVTAWAVTAPGADAPDPQALFRWLSGADPERLAEHGPSVAGAILAASPGTGALRWIDEAAAAGRLELDRTAVRAPLLSAEIEEVRGGGTPPRTVLDAVPADPQASRDAESEVSSAIVLGSDTQVDRLLCLARRHGITLNVAPLGARLQTFADGWIARPDLPYSPREWALREDVLDRAYEALHHRFAVDGLPGVLAALRRQWSHFADRMGDPTDPLDCHLAAASIAALPREERAARAQDLLARAVRSALPLDACHSVQRAFAEWGVLGPDVAFAVVSALPEQVRIEPEIVQAALAELDRPGRITALALDVVETLSRRGHVAAGHPLAKVLTADQNLLALVRAAPSADSARAVDALRPSLAALRKAHPGVVTARLPELLSACLECPLPDFGAVALASLQPAQARALIGGWGRELSGQRSVQAAIRGVSWMTFRKVPDQVKHEIAEGFRALGAGSDPADWERWAAVVDGGLTDEEAEIWSELAAASAPKARRLRWMREKGGR